MWKVIQGYLNYEVSDTGLVRNIKTNRILKNTIMTNGYEKVTLSQNGITKHFYVHRLVAEAFLDNPNNFPVVNHKDENKTNNSVDNLEWCTYEYNLKYSDNWSNSRKKVKCIETDTIYDSLAAVGKITGVCTSSICAVCNGKRKTAGGYHWTYI